MGRALELLVVAGTVAELLSVMLALLSVELVLLTAELVEVVCCVAVVVDVGGGVVVVTDDNVPVKDRSWFCGIPRWLVSTATVWAAVNWPFSLKLNVSP